MFSRLDPVFRTILRRTEETDARLHIRRDESQGQGKGKKGSESGEYSPLAWEDSATVSVAALKAFLQTLLQGTLPMQDTRFPSTPSSSLPDKDVGSVSYRAAQAYQTTGRAVHDPNIEMPPPPLPPAGGGAAEAISLGSDFSEKDLADVQRFVTDLIELERLGVVDLTIQRSQTFLEGVRQAIEKAKEAFL